MTSVDASELFRELSNLKAGWGADGDEDPPSQHAIERAKQFVVWAHSVHLRFNSIDPDAMGGVAVYFYWLDGARYWAGFMNDGNDFLTRVDS